ncbi:DNA primase [Virgibacillus dakarensis]|uniref:DNA primase n=1 Tax=Virgibacillus dakarensis TaxID=1917889 RepID=UPI000B443237|nr:DNA primase [Virgibacillus dakarensis]MBT2214489.1 DNA primase [Virgibacillus dakarensis]
MPKQIPEDVIERIRKANDIVDVIGEYVQLKKQGRSYMGLCPFHGEKTPSFSVTQDKQIFRCFGCGKGGNVVTFLMEMESYSFYEALKFLADRSGVKLPEMGMRENSSLSEENQSILSAHEWLQKLYHHLLRFTKDGKEGYQYLIDRGIKQETIDLFQLGFAPNVKDFTAEFLEKKGFHQQVLVKAGLLSLRDDDTVADRFRGRVIFPIRNHLGKTVAFGGRAIAGQEPKYLNSPESDLFQKGKLLYNFDQAKKHIRSSGEAILLEGYMDVIAAFQAGVKNVIATLGTSLTENQAKLLRRYVDTVVVCYDSDNAGTEAAYKAANLLRQVGCKVKVARMEDGMDPDDYIKAYGANAFTDKVIKASDTYMSFYMRYMKKDYNLNLEGDRINYLEIVLKQLAVIDNAVEREYYVKELSREYGLTMDTLNQEILKIRQNMGINKDKREKKRYTTNNAKDIHQNKKLLPAFHNAERQLIAYMLKDTAIADKVQEQVGGSFNLEEHKIITTHLYAYYEEGHPADVSLFVDRLNDEKIIQIVIEIAMMPVVEDISDKEINDYIRIIRAENSDMATIKVLKEKQRLAEQQSDPIKAAQIAMEIIEIQKQLKSPI